MFATIPFRIFRVPASNKN